MIEKTFTSTKNKNSARKNKNYISFLSCCECISLHIAYDTSVSETKAPEDGLPLSVNTWSIIKYFDIVNTENNFILITPYLQKESLQCHINYQYDMKWKQTGI